MTHTAQRLCPCRFAATNRRQLAARHSSTKEENAAFIATQHANLPSSAHRSMLVSNESGPACQALSMKPNVAEPCFAARASPFAVYLMLYLTGTVTLTLDPNPGGNGRPLAFRAISSAAWSSVDDPELPTTCADMT